MELGFRVGDHWGVGLRIAGFNQCSIVFWASVGAALANLIMTTLSEGVHEFGVVLRRFFPAQHGLLHEVGQERGQGASEVRDATTRERIR